MSDKNKGSMMETIEIRGILLTHNGNNIIVSVWMLDGSYREVIRERVEGPISHCVYAGGICIAEVVPRQGVNYETNN